MTLSLGLDVAQSGLSVTADQTSVVSRNVARAGDPNASRKIANVVTGPGGGVRLASITRVSNASLLDKKLGASSGAAAQKAIVDALAQLDETINDPELDASPAALVQKLANALQQFSAAPQDLNLARSAVATAGNLASALNDATTLVQQVRQQADADISGSVADLNNLLSQFATVNSEIVQGTRTGADVTDYLDQRDQILNSISEEVGVRTVTRADNDMAIYTDSGVTLFDVSARKITFDRTLIYAPTTAGNPVLADGVPIIGNSGPMLAASGRLTGLAAVRDSATVTYQSQLDEIARGLIEAFSESDQSATPTLPDAVGLFTYPGAPAVPTSGSIVTGLAGAIRLNSSVDPAQGGNVELLRDGGIAGAAYVSNTTGAAAYTDRIQQLLGQMNQQRSFDGATELAPTATLAGFASVSGGWLEQARKSASDEADYRNTLLERSSEALSKATGVNLDEEMTLLLDLERSYQASARLIAAIDNMLQTLLAATVPAA